MLSAIGSILTSYEDLPPDAVIRHFTVMTDHPGVMRDALRAATAFNLAADVAALSDDQDAAPWTNPRELAYAFGFHTPLLGPLNPSSPGDFARVSRELVVPFLKAIQVPAAHCFKEHDVLVVALDHVERLRQYAALDLGEQFEFSRIITSLRAGVSDRAMAGRVRALNLLERQCV